MPFTIEKDFEYKCSVCPPEFSKIKMIKEKSFGDYGSQQSDFKASQNMGAILNVGSILQGAQGQIGDMAIGATGLPFGDIKSALGIAKGFKNPCAKPLTSLLSGMFTALSAVTGVPFFLLNSGLGGMLSCEAGRTKLKAAIASCAGSLSGGAFDTFLGINNGRLMTDSNFGPSQYPGMPNANSDEARKRRAVFIDKFVEVLSVGAEFDKAMAQAYTQVISNFSSFSPDQISMWRDQAAANKLTATDKMVISTTGGSTDWVNSVIGNQPGYAETKFLLQMCMNGIVKEVTKATDPANYEKYANDVLKSVGNFGSQGSIFSDPLSLLGIAFAASGAVALIKVKKG